MELIYPNTGSHELTDAMIAHNALVSTIGAEYDRYIMYTIASEHPGLITEVDDYERQFYEISDYLVARLPIPEGVSSRPTLPLPDQAECVRVVDDSLTELRQYATLSDSRFLRKIFKQSLTDALFCPPPGLTGDDLALFQQLMLQLPEPVTGVPLTTDEIKEVISIPA